MASLQEVVERNMNAAQESTNGRSAELLAHDGVLRQTVIALKAGTRLGEHNSPHAATLQVLQGHLRVEVGSRQQGEFRSGELWVLTHERHSVVALEDSAFLLTTVTSVPESAS